MSVIATVTIPAQDFALGAALAANPGIQVRLDQVVPVGDRFVPYLWAANESVQEIERELSREANILAFDIVDRVDDKVLARVDWSAGTNGFIEALARTDVSILEGSGASDVWRFQLRFDDHDQLTEFYRYCVEEGIDLELENVNNPGSPHDIGLGVDLTDAQREALELAFERGYFDVPRRTNIVELAEELGISDSAVSQRLRRGTAALLAVLLDESEDEFALDA